MGDFPPVSPHRARSAANIDRKGWHVRCTSDRHWRCTVPTLIHPDDLTPRRHRWPIGVVLAAILIAASAALSSAQGEVSEPVGAFMTATHDYAQMHRRLEQPIGPIEITTSIDQINRMIEQLAAAIRAERADAKRGDLFTSALAHELRARINDALLAHDFTAADVVAAGRVDGIDYARVQLRVNGTFPWVLGAAMFPCVLEALPELPPELQYRIVGTDLVLIDVHASLIVDIMPSALAWATER
jgi:signal transduction histidine kinase